MIIIQSRHGYFRFNETDPGELARFSSVYDLDLVSLSDYYTFSFLEEAKRYSLIGKDYLGLPATALFEGEPWEVMEKNGFIYDLELDLLKPVISVSTTIELQAAELYYISKSLIQPGSLLKSGQRVVDYTAMFDWKIANFKYTEIGFL